jgi:hypothetical protein
MLISLEAFKAMTYVQCQQQFPVRNAQSEAIRLWVSQPYNNDNSYITLKSVYLQCLGYNMLGKVV